MALSNSAGTLAVSLPGTKPHCPGGSGPWPVQMTGSHCRRRCFFRSFWYGMSLLQLSHRFFLQHDHCQSICIAQLEKHPTVHKDHTEEV